MYKCNIQTFTYGEWWKYFLLTKLKKKKVIFFITCHEKIHMILKKCCMMI